MKKKIICSVQEKPHASTRSSVCHCLRVPGCEVSAFLFFSIIITRISCGSLLQIFIESNSYVIHRSRHSYSESDTETMRQERGGQGMKLSHIDRMTNKETLTKLVKNLQEGEEFHEETQRKKMNSGTSMN